MIVGSVHTIEYLELLYWLDRAGYDGYLSMDQYPYREDTERAISESIQWLKAFRAIINRAGIDMITDVIRRGDATEASAMLREAMFGGEQIRISEAESGRDAFTPAAFLFQILASRSPT